MHIPFFNLLSLPCVLPNHRLSEKECCFVDREIQKLRDLQVVKDVQESFISVSPLAVVLKTEVKHRLFLVNESISTPSGSQTIRPVRTPSYC